MLCEVRAPLVTNAALKFLSLARDVVGACGCCCFVDSSRGRMPAPNVSMAVALLENIEQQFGHALEGTRPVAVHSHRTKSRELCAACDPWVCFVCHIAYSVPLWALVFAFLFVPVGTGPTSGYGRAVFPCPYLCHVESLEYVCIGCVAEEQEPSSVQVTQKIIGSVDGLSSIRCHRCVIWPRDR